MGSVKHDLDALVDASRHGDDPTAADRERVRRRVAGRIGAGVVAAGVASGVAGTTANAAGLAAATSTGIGLGAKVLVTLAVVAGLGGTAGVLAHRSSQRREVHESPSSRGAAAPSATRRGGVSSGVAAATLLRASPAPVPSSLSITASPAAVATASALRSTVAMLDPPRPVRATVRPAVGLSRIATASAEPDEPDLSAESSQFGAVREALQRDPARSLALLDRYVARYPRGQFRIEVVPARAIALCALGRTDEGRALLRALAEAPAALLAERAHAACERRDAL